MYGMFVVIPHNGRTVQRVGNLLGARQVVDEGLGLPEAVALGVHRLDEGGDDALWRVYVRRRTSSFRRSPLAVASCVERLRTSAFISASDRGSTVIVIGCDRTADTPGCRKAWG